MPNHVTNTIRIELTKDSDLNEFLEKIKGEDTVLDFGKIIPETDEVKESIDDNGAMRRGTPFWYNWRVENWGTKWNAYDVDEVGRSDGPYPSVKFKFDTAWAPPLPIIEALREWPEVEWVGGNWVEEFCQSAGVFD